MAVGVVGLLLLRIGEHLVGLGGLLELLLGIGIVAVYVRVEFPGDPAEGFLDLGVGRVPGHAQDLVVVAFAHE